MGRAMVSFATLTKPYATSSSDIVLPPLAVSEALISVRSFSNAALDASTSSGSFSPLPKICKQATVKY